MANNIFAGRANIILSKAGITTSFVDAGLNAGNLLIIYKVGASLQSYVPGRSINPITAFEGEQGYWIVPISDMDLTAYALPPIPASALQKRYKFDGTDQNITVANQADFAFNTGDFTVLFDGTVTEINGYVFLGRSATGRSWDVSFAESAGAGVVAGGFFQGTGGGGNYLFSSSPVDFLINIKYRVAVVFEATTITVYVNAVDDTSATPGGTFSGRDTAGTFKIGNVGTAIISHDSILDELVIVDRALTPTEILEDFNTGVMMDRLTASFAADIVGYWRFDGDLVDQLGTHNGTATTPVYL